MAILLLIASSKCTFLCVCSVCILEQKGRMPEITAAKIVVAHCKKKNNNNRINFVFPSCGKWFECIILHLFVAQTWYIFGNFSSFIRLELPAAARPENQVPISDFYVLFRVVLSNMYKGGIMEKMVDEVIFFKFIYLFYFRVCTDSMIFSVDIF